MPLASLFVELLLADATDVRRVLFLLDGRVSGGVVVRFVQAQMLGVTPGRLGSLDNDRIDRPLQQFGVVDICACQSDAQRAAVCIDDYAAFRAGFAAIRGIRADKIPPKRALPMAPSALCHSQLTPPRSWQFSTSNPQMR